MQSFVVNRHGRVVLPSNFFAELDFSVFDDLDQFARVVRRDFEEKAPTATEIVIRAKNGLYTNRYQLLRDLAVHLFWVNRYSLTMYDKRVTRWRDLPRNRRDCMLPVVEPWEGAAEKVGAVAETYQMLEAAWDPDAEQRIFDLLFAVFEDKQHSGTELPAIKPTVAELRCQPERLTFILSSYDPDYPTFSEAEIVDHVAAVPELEALGRWAMVLHNQYPFERDQVVLAPVGEVRDDDFVVAFYPRNREVARFIDRVRSAPSYGGSDVPAAASAPGEAPGSSAGEAATFDAPTSGDPTARRSPGAGTAAVSRQPVRPFTPLRVRDRCQILPRLVALGVAKGEKAFTNDDVVRNSACNWSPMSAQDIARKTGIEQRLYTEQPLEELALEASRRALRHGGVDPEEIGAVVVCTCTSDRLIPSVAAWIAGELGIYQAYGTYDLVAACAGLPYGLTDAVHLLQLVQRPVLLVCAEKFSDKIGSVRTSRMIFGDGAAALVIAPAPDGQPPDIEVLQTYGGGPVSQVSSIIWPNPAFDNNITVFGPEVKAMAERYLRQMIDEVGALPGSNGVGSLLSEIELVVPHQANKTMVMALAELAGIPLDRLYFNIEHVGNVSSASIPLAIYDAVADGTIDRPMTLLTPGFGAGAVAGYCVLRVDPTVVAAPTAVEVASSAPPVHGIGLPARGASSDDVRVAFGE